MNFKTIIASTLLAASLVPAFAADQTVSFAADDTASFVGTKTLLAGGDDVITFSGLATGNYDFSLTLSGLNINLTSLSLNGTAGTVDQNGKFLFADVEGNGNTPFELTLTGTTLNKFANYSGQLFATPVIEPKSYALLLAGLGFLAFIGRRRQDA